MHVIDKPMPNNNFNHRHYCRNQQGSTLIEVLVTMLIVALGLLGAGGLQLATTRYQQTAYMRDQASAQAQFIAEKIRANSNALAAYLTDGDSYDTATISALDTDPKCGMGTTSTCTAAQSALKDLHDWRRSLEAMPGGRGSIHSVTDGSVTDPLARQVIVMWREKQQNEVGTTSNPTPSAVTDTNCPTPRVAGVRCFITVITP